MRGKYEGKGVHLIAGGAFAAGLEEYRRAHYLDHCLPDECMDRARLACVLSWGDFPPFPPDYANGEHLIHAKSLDRIMGAIEGYVAKWPPLLDRLQPIASYRDGEVSFEYSFAVPLDMPQFPRHPSGE